MKCPLLATAWGAVAALEQQEYPDCLKEECAWWDKGGLRCGLMSLLERLGWMEKTLDDIAGMMPHGEKSAD